MCDRCKRLEDAILAIDAKATPYGPPIVENGEEYAKAYLIPAGPLHRALGVVGRCALRVTSARTEIDARSVGVTLNNPPSDPQAPLLAPPVPMD